MHFPSSGDTDDSWRLISPQLTIRGLRVRGLDLALAKPTETAAGVMRTAPLVLIDPATEEGITGRSYLRCYTPAALVPLVRLAENLEPLLVGEPAGQRGWYYRRTVALYAPASDSALTR